MADSKLADLTATTAPASTDLLYIVVDPSGTPLDRKVTVANLFSGRTYPEIGRVKPSGGTASLVMPGTAASNTTTWGLGSGTLFYTPWLVEEQITVDALVVLVTTAGAAGKLIRLGLYAADGDWQPTGSILSDGGTVAADSTGLKTAVLGSAQTLTPGRYVAACVSDGTPTLLGARDARVPCFNPAMTAQSNSFRVDYTKSGQSAAVAGGLASPGTAWDSTNILGSPGGGYLVFARLSAN